MSIARSTWGRLAEQKPGTGRDEDSGDHEEEGLGTGKHLDADYRTGDDAGERAEEQEPE